jgi:YVTN family beta-propeller protein
MVRAGVVLAAALCGCAEKKDWLESNPSQAVSPFATQHSASDGALTPTQQLLTPAGRQVELSGVRPAVLGLSPDGKTLVTTGWGNSLLVIDPDNGGIRQRVDLADEYGRRDPKAAASVAGLVFSLDGARIFLSNREGNILRFSVDREGRVRDDGVFRLPGTGIRDEPAETPAGLAISDDGQKLYAALNVSNRLLELDAATGKVLRKFDVGNAPFDVVVLGDKAYVSNWGGRRAGTNDVSGPIGVGGHVRVDPVKFVANEGSVSIVDLKSGKTKGEIIVGIHASGMAKSPDGKFIAVANSNSDTVSIIDSSTDAVVETISTRLDKSDLFGASPDAVVFDASGKQLFVCNGAQNAVAVVDFAPGDSHLRGLIPVGWFPGAIIWDDQRQAIGVANIKGLGSGARLAAGQRSEFNSMQFLGTISLIANPDGGQLEKLTDQVLTNNRRRAQLAAMLPARQNVKPTPVPERVGESSVFKHVVYIIKENRTYDQVLGDMKEGNGDSSLCIYGEKITPNQHKLARDYVLLDNTYCSGARSADGHQWADSAFCTDYVERSFVANFPRSFPFGGTDWGVDALAYAPSGFIWDNALAHGKTLRDYGEFSISTSGWADTSKKTMPTFSDYYQDYINGAGATRISSRPGIESLRNYLDMDTVGWDLKISDQVRASRFIGDLGEFERAGKFPDMCIVWLPNDHTSATAPGAPTPRAMVADNDLALGRIVEAVSHSPFWNETCIVVMEDDTQDGWDHVNAYRTTAFVISPYTKCHAVIHTNYTQPGLMHTIELILGLPPMNELDAQAIAMKDCFSDTADFSAWSAVPSEVPLDEMNPSPAVIQDREKREFAEASAKLPLAVPDACPEGLLNRILWNAEKGSGLAYPAKFVAKDGDDDR